MIKKSSKITSKGQVTIPMRVMKKLGISPGDAVLFDEQGSKVVLRPASKEFSAIDLHKKYQYLNVRKLTVKDLNEAREKAWTTEIKKKFGKK